MKRYALAALAAATSGAALLATAAAGAPAGAASRPSAAGGKTLVIDNSFQLVTADPGHMFEPTGELVDNALYDTLDTFSGGNFKKVVPDLATSWQTLNGGRKFVFHLNPAAKFSDGTPVTSSDVVWSLKRMVNLKGNPSFLLAGETIAAQGPETVVFTSKTPNPALLYILANPACGALNEKVVVKHGGTDAANASTKDSAENWLNTHSAGSGPYIMKSFSTTTQTVLVANPNYWGPKPVYSTVVLRNVTAAEQGLDVQRGKYEIGLDLNPPQAAALRGVHVVRGPSPNVFFLFNNENPKVSTTTSNKDFQQAVRYAIDYPALLRFAGSGAVQAPGVIPTVFFGALPKSANTLYNPTLAKSYLKRSGISNPTVTLSYPSPLQLNGIDFGALAQLVQQQLQAVGINVTLAPAAVQVALQTYRGGQEQMGLWEWGPDYPDAQDYLVFAPGNLVGLRAGWTATDNPALARLAAKTGAVVGSARLRAYQTYQRQLNAQGPFVPLFQSAEVVIATKNIKNVQANGLWYVDLRQLG